MKFSSQKHFLGILLLIIGQIAFNSAYADDNSVAAREKRVTDLKQKLEYIQYGAAKPKAIVYVFTDMNCTFCNKLHHEFPKLADQGVQVRVLAMPRQGLDSEGFREWVSIWCSKDPNDSLDRAMEGEEIAPRTCKNPIKMHYSLGRKWGVIGTPSVLFADGTLKAGYFSAEKLAKEAIKRSAAMEKEEEKSEGNGNDKIDDKTADKAISKGDENTKNNSKNKTKTNVKPNEKTNEKVNEKSNIKADEKVNDKKNEKVDVKTNEKANGKADAKINEKNKSAEGKDLTKEAKDIVIETKVKAKELIKETKEKVIEEKNAVKEAIDNEKGKSQEKSTEKRTEKSTEKTREDKEHEKNKSDLDKAKKDH